MKPSLAMLIILIAILTACGSYEGTVTDKKNASFIKEVFSEYPEEKTVEMHLTNGTVLFDELKESDQIRVVPFNLPKDLSYILPSEVIVEYVIFQ
ncbi:hypothetical protein [Planococcus soli]|uniref:hypothetical protein n=1 Tax=Planococcus soli TaxID=2666072 RepID=UPI00115E2D33|nr:hypothetical protein [Planococcus soli]